MNIDRYLQISQEIEQREKQVEDSKRQSYTVGDTDVLRNFKRDAATAGITPMQNWLTHYLKQHAAILSYILHPDVQPSEPLVSRVGDLRTYLKLLVAIAEDEGRDTGLVPEYVVNWAEELEDPQAFTKRMENPYPTLNDHLRYAGVRKKPPVCEHMCYCTHEDKLKPTNVSGWIDCDLPLGHGGLHTSLWLDGAYAWPTHPGQTYGPDGWSE